MSENIKERQFSGGAWAIFKEAIAGTTRDLTEIPLGTAIILLAVPMILEMVMESVFAVVDVFFVAKLGADAVAVVGLTESMIAIIYAAAIGLSVGATATVARRIGEKDPDGAARFAVHSLYLGIIVSALLAAIGIIFAPDLLRLLGASESVISQGANFTRVMLGGNAVIVFLFLLNAIFRGAGDAAIAMRVLWLANILNCILAPCFIFGLWIFPEMGVTGAAVGTTIGRGVGVLFAAWNLFFRRGGRIEILPRHFALNAEIVKQILKISSSAMVQYTIATASWIGLVRVVAGFGSEALAGYTIGLRIIVFALLPSLGMSNAAATLVGQNLGAGKPERAELAVWRAGLYSACSLAVIGLFFIAFAPQIVGLFTPEIAVANYAVDCLRIVSLGFFFYGFGIVTEQAFNGAGDTLTPTYMNLFVFWLFEIPLAYVLAYHFGLGPRGVFLAITAAFSLLAIVAVLLFRRGKWKTNVV